MLRCCQPFCYLEFFGMCLFPPCVQLIHLNWGFPNDSGVWVEVGNWCGKQLKIIRILFYCYYYWITTVYCYCIIIIIVIIICVIVIIIVIIIIIIIICVIIIVVVEKWSFGMQTTWDVIRSSICFLSHWLFIVWSARSCPAPVPFLVNYLWAKYFNNISCQVKLDFFIRDKNKWTFCLNAELGWCVKLYNFKALKANV